MTKAEQITRRNPAEPNRSEQVIWDPVVPELGHRIRNGRETWIVQRRISGKTRKQTLGTVEGLDVGSARELVSALLAQLSESKDARAAEPRLQAFSEQFLKDCSGQWKPATLRHNRRALETKIVPHFGNCKISTLQRSDIVAWHQSYVGAPSSANRHLAVLSSLMRHAELMGLREPGSTPCRGLRRHQSQFKAIYLDAAGWMQLGAKLLDAEPTHPELVSFIRFLCLTGCRRGEAQSLTWSMIERGRAILPDSKTGVKTIWLGKPLKRLLSALPRNGTHVFADMNGALRTSQIDRFWRGLRVSLGQKHLRLHDLRHSFASAALNGGIDLRTVGGLLGHSDLGSTAGYAQLDEAPVKAASVRVGDTFDQIMQVVPKKPRPVVNPYLAFTRSKQSMAAFCQQQGLDRVIFHKGLMAWRQSTQQAVSGDV